MKARVTNHGSLFVFTPDDDDARAWVEENVGDGNTQTWAGGVVVEPRYIHPIVHGFRDAGGEVS